MNALWAICLLLAAPPGESAAPAPPDPVAHLIPESLTQLLSQRPELRAHHQGFLQELARRPDLAKTETAWWQASRTPALRRLAAHFEDALARDNTAQYRFNTFYQALAGSPELRAKVETLVRVETEKTRRKPELAGALQFLRANPDIALRFLRDPRTVRPLPAPLEATYAFFEAETEWREALFAAYDAIAQTPDAYRTVFPWWRQLAALPDPDGDGADLDAALHRRPQQYWLWHLRNLNLANNTEIAPWIRYWQRLVQRDPDVAREYGPFIGKLLENPEQLRQHLADLAEKGEDTGAKPAWPPGKEPPPLPPLPEDPRDKARDQIQRPDITYPERPERPTVERPPRPDGPQRPTPPARPERTPSRAR